MPVIDLDRPAAPPAPQRRRSHGLVVGALLVGALLGASGAYASQRPAPQEPKVFVFAEVNVNDGRRPADIVVQAGRIVTVTLTRHVTFVNADQKPVNVRDLVASRAGVSVRGVSKQRWIAPGATTQADVDLQVDCARGLPLTRLPVAILVETIDDEEREARPREGIDITPWSDQAEQACY